MGDLKDAKGVVDQGDLELGDSSSDDSTQEFEVEEGYGAKQVMSKINELRKSHVGYCDLNVHVDGIDFPAHQVILAGFSPYFERRILGNNGKHLNSSTIELTGMTAETFKSVLDFAYTSRITITAANVESLLRAATFIEASQLSKVCEEYLATKIDSNNFVKFLDLASKLSSSVLADLINKYILKNFAEICQQEEFLELKTETLIDAIKSDELEVPDEEVVLDAVIKWTNHQKDRKDLLPKVFTYLRWAYISPAVLNKWIEKDDVRTSTDFTYWVSKVFLYKSGCEPEMLPTFAKPRHSFISTANQLSLTVPVFGFQVILCEGQAGISNFSRPLYLFNIENGTTRQLNPLPEECRITSVTLSADFVVYVVSEQTVNKETSGFVFRYCLSSGKWTKLCSVHTPTNRKVLLEVNGLLYVRTQCSDGSWFLQQHEIGCNSPFRYHQLAPTPGNRMHHIIDSANKMIYAIGNNSRGTYKYNIPTNTWTKMSDLLCAYDKYLCCHYNGKIYVFDGRQGNSKATIMKPQVYDISKDKWEWGPRLNKVYWNPAALVVVNGYLTFVDKSRSLLLQIERFCSTKNLWEIVDTQVRFEKGLEEKNWEFFQKEDQS